MTNETLRTASTLVANISMGLTAGVFALYAHTIMPALKQTDDQAFVTAFQSIDRAIINPWFIGGTFLGALGLTTPRSPTAGLQLSVTSPPRSGSISSSLSSRSLFTSR
jgi:hypothetical protein